MIKHSITVLLLFLNICMLQAHIKLDTLSVHAGNMLKELNSTIISYRQNDKKNPDYGAIMCPHCNLYHTRAAEALYPFTFEYTLTKNKDYLHAAIDLGNWLIKQQTTDGSWLETPEEWTGTTTDQVLMMALAFPFLKPHLSKEETKRWLSSIEKAGDYLEKIMSPEFASINYCATTTASLMFVDKLIPKESYRNKARVLAHKIIAKMDQDYFITGEGGRVFSVKYGVDLGYNMEMSLWGLALYAQLSNDNLVMQYVEKSLERHLHFIYPDGSLDGSWGIRSNKWTCFGSATSDGCQVLFSLFAHKNDQYRTAAIKNIQYLYTCMKNGIVGYGPLYFDIFNVLPCIYPTFTKAKNMAMAIQFSTADVGPEKALPTEKMGALLFPSLDVAVVRTKNWCTTISSYGYKDPNGERSKYMHRPTGGAMTNLWLLNHGFFQASSQTIYKRWEPMSFPDVSGMCCITPRIEFNSKNGYFTNLYEFDAKMNLKNDSSPYVISSMGELKNSKQQEGGIAYTLKHEIADNYIKKEIELIFHDATDTVYVIEPIIHYPGMEFIPSSDQSVIIKTENQIVTFRSETPGVIAEPGNDTDKYWSVYPALKAYPICLKIVPEKNEYRKKISFNYKISNI